MNLTKLCAKTPSPHQIQVGDLLPLSWAPRRRSRVLGLFGSLTWSKARADIGMTTLNGEVGPALVNGQREVPVDEPWPTFRPSALDTAVGSPLNDQADERHNGPSGAPGNGGRIG